MPRPSRVVLLGIVIPAIVFAALAAELIRADGFGWDEQVSRAVGHAIEALPVSVDGSWILDESVDLALLAIGGFAVLLFARIRQRDALYWTIAVVSVFALDPILKGIFRRPAIESTSEYSFPSGSAMLATVAVTALVLLLPPSRVRAAVGAVGAALALAYGAAIVYEEWHYPSDVVAGWLFGVAWATLLWVIAGTRRGPTRSPSGAGRS